MGVGEEEVEVKARLQSLTLPHAVNWLNVAPIISLGLHLRPQEFVLAAGYRLGLPLYGEGPAPTCPVCHQPSDRRGTHSMSCGSGPERNWRHNSLRDAMHEYAVEAGYGPRKEVRFLLPGRDSRPADVLIPHFAGGRAGRDQGPRKTKVSANASFPTKSGCGSAYFFQFLFATFQRDFLLSSFFRSPKNYFNQISVLFR